MKTLSNYELACLPEGTRVIFVDSFDIFPEALIPANTVCTIKENGFNEIWSAMLLLPDDEKLQEKLGEHWEGGIHLSGGEPGEENEHESWTRLSPIALHERVTSYVLQDDVWEFQASSDITECFPDDWESTAAAINAIKKTGEYISGGGAAPIFKLTQEK